MEVAMLNKMETAHSDIKMDSTNESPRDYANDFVWIREDDQEKKIEGYKKSVTRGCWQGANPKWEDAC